MPPRLDITGLRNGKAYNLMEPVRGLVHLRAGSRAPVVFKVTVTLEGAIRTSLIEKGPTFILGNDMPLVASEDHQLFKLSKVLFHDQNAFSSTFQYTPFNREYVIPFEIDFPRQTQCAKHPDEPTHRRVMLPPSFEAHTTKSGAAARVEYTIRIDVEGSEGNTSFKRAVMLSAAEPLHLALMSERAFYSTMSVLDLDLDWLVRTVKLPHLRLQYVPPTLSLEARLPSPILRIGERLLLQLFVRGPPLQDEAFLLLKLSSLRISLESRTNIMAKARAKSWTTSTDLLNLKSLSKPVSCLAGHEALSDINETISHRVCIPDVAPSFASCTVQRTYSLAVDARFSFRKASKAQSIKLLINVEIWPANRTGQGSSTIPASNCRAPRDRTPSVALRGDLSHLGYTETYDSEPPPYS